MLDRLAVGPENFEPGPTRRQRLHGQGLRQDRVEPLGAFGEQGLAEGQGQVPQLVIGRGDRDRQRALFLGPREGLVATPLVLDQGIGDQMGQRAELQLLLEAGPAISPPEIIQPRIRHRVVQQPPHRVGQRKPTQHLGGKRGVVEDRRTPDGCGKDGDLHNRRTPERTEGAIRWVFMIRTSDSRWNAKTLNSLPSKGGDGKRDFSRSDSPSRRGGSGGFFGSRLRSVPASCEAP